jgi:hypothetical protein
MFPWPGVVAVHLAGALVVSAPVAADIASDRAAAIIVFPKVVVNTEEGLDTLIRLSNTSDREVGVLCFYINATPKCTLPTRSCFPDPSDCHDAGGICRDFWQETDFRITLTAKQPTAWLASEPSGTDCRFVIGTCSNNPDQTCRLGDSCGPNGRCVIPPCFPLDGTATYNTRTGESNAESKVIPVSEDPFIGELKCVAVDDNGAPVPRNVLKGEALIGLRSNGTLDIAGYNALGIPALAGRGNRDNTLVLGGPRRQDGSFEDHVEYEGCPNLLILDHFFDGAVDPLVPNFCREDDTCSISGNACADDDDCVNRCEGDTCTISGTGCSRDPDCSALVGQARVGTDLTLIPCTQDFRTQDTSFGKTVTHFLVFNEFEQRFSTSRTVECFKEIRLSNIDTNDNERSILAAGVAGTLTGQTRIRGFDARAEDRGNTLLGLAEEFRCAGPGFPFCSLLRTEDLISSNAANVHIQGTRAVSDFLYLP